MSGSATIPSPHVDPVRNSGPIQYVSDLEGRPTGVIVPIDLWHEIASERETAYLLSSPAMKKRLLEAKGRRDGITIEEVRAKLGI